MNNINNHAGFFLSLFFSGLLFSSIATAFSPSPEAGATYTPANWSQSLSAKKEAMRAIEHKDFRLLALAGKNKNIPGIKNTQVADYQKKCGVRYFKEFSDMIREKKELERRKKAKIYALAYNQTIIKHCYP